MKTAVAGDKRVSRLAGKQRFPSEETGLVASRYALRYTAPGGKCFLWNELTRSLLLPETPEEQAFLDYFEDIGASEPLPRRRIPEELVKTATASCLF
ncbi:MAG: hypothetical protein J6H18_05230 [Lachnospiraceae bacterium]|nr:hypothetical protein [Lachnospiraceae bacterium]